MVNRLSKHPRPLFFLIFGHGDPFRAPGVSYSNYIATNTVCKHRHRRGLHVFRLPVRPSDMPVTHGHPFVRAKQDDPVFDIFNIR